MTRQDTRPAAALPATAVVLFVAAYIALAVLSGSPGRWDRQFDEGGAIDILSALFLIAAGLLAGACFRLRGGEPGPGRCFWLLLSLGFLFVALDELLQLHETFDEWLRDTRVGWPPLFRNWNDVIVIAYGLVGLATLAAFWSEVRRLPRVVPLLGLGVVFYVLHTGIDTLVSGSAFKNLVEESAKLFATAFFTLAMLAALRALRARRARSPLFDVA